MDATFDETILNGSILVIDQHLIASHLVEFFDELIMVIAVNLPEKNSAFFNYYYENIAIEMETSILIWLTTVKNSASAKQSSWSVDIISNFNDAYWTSMFSGDTK